MDNLITERYIIEVLESSIWFFLKKESFEDTILSIINIGHDSDSSAATTGGLARIYYGQNAIPVKWINKITRVDDIINFGKKFNKKFIR